MKRIWLAVLFLTLAAAVCITDQICVSTFYNEMSAKIQQAQAYEKTGSEQLPAAIDDIKRYWDERNDRMFMLTHHGALNELSAVIRSLNTEQLDNRLNEAAAWLTVFYENQRITFANIF